MKTTTTKKIIKKINKQHSCSYISYHLLLLLSVFVTHVTLTDCNDFGSGAH